MYLASKWLKKTPNCHLQGIPNPLLLKAVTGFLEGKESHRLRPHLVLTVGREPNNLKITLHFLLSFL